MITGKAIYDVLAAMVPLYVVMILAYGSVRWWKVMTVEQCAGINRYVSAFAVPFLSLGIIYNNDVYTMNFRFIAADTLEKFAVLVVLFLWHAVSKRCSLDWIISLFSICTLPNTLVIGIPLLTAMYGEMSGPLMVQIVVMQGVVWYNLLLIMLEYRAAKALFSKRLPPEAARAVASFRVEPDVHSLAGSEPLQAAAEVRDDGKFEVIVKRSSSRSLSNNFGSSGFRHLRTPSDLADVEMYSMRSDSDRGVMSRHPSFYRAYCDGCRLSSVNADTPSMHMAGSINTEHGKLDHGENEEGGVEGNGHTFDWSSSHRQSMEPDKMHTVILKPATSDLLIDTDPPPPTDVTTRGISHKSNGEAIIEAGGARGSDPMPPAFVVMKLIMIMACRKIIRNPNTYASVGGLVWSLIAFRWNFRMPKIIEGCITILSNTGMGMSMFSLGLFMAMQPKITTVGMKAAVFSMAVRFLVGPAVAATAAAAVGLRGDLLRVAVVQAALPQAIVTFVFAKEYDCHPDLLSTSIIFGLVVSLPVTIIYYLVLGL